MSNSSSTRRQTGILSRGTSWSLVGVLALGVPGTVGAAEAALSGAPAQGGLSVATLPTGAAVYVDGQMQGEAPLDIQTAPGEHRVKVVKEGFLDNSRVLNVVSGKTRSMNVTLTPVAPDAAAAVQEPHAWQAEPAAADESGGGSRTNNILLMGVGVAAAGAGFALRSGESNDAPVAGTVGVSPATGLASATSITFSASGVSDPDGDTLSLSWDFGDGSNGSGSPVSHTYADAGTFNVTLTVNDGELSAMSTGSVTISDLTGSWSGNLVVPQRFFPIGFTLNQNGSSITGTFVDREGIIGSVTGTVSPSRSVSLTVTQAADDVARYFGTINEEFRTIIGVTDFDIVFRISR